MKEDLVDLLSLIFAMTMTIVLFGVFFCVPLAWFDGHAKSAFLKQTQNIEMPWYQATFLEVNTNNISLTTQQKEKQ